MVSGDPVPKRSSAGGKDSRGNQAGRKDQLAFWPAADQIFLPRIFSGVCRFKFPFPGIRSSLLFPPRFLRGRLPVFLAGDILLCRQRCRAASGQEAASVSEKIKERGGSAELRPQGAEMRENMAGASSCRPYRPHRRRTPSVRWFHGVMKKLLGLICFLIAIGMLIMLITHNRLIGLIIIALFLFMGYNCFCGD